MFNSRALLAALLGLSVPAHVDPINLLPRSFTSAGKQRRRIDYHRARAKHLIHGYPGAKLARKAYLGEVGLQCPR